MTMDRQTHRLVSEIITVLERHGHHARDREHADQAVNMITDLAGIYDGTRDVPASTGRHAPRGCPTPGHPAGKQTPTPSSLPAPTSAPSSPPSTWPPSTSGTSPKPAPTAPTSPAPPASTASRDAEAYDRLADRILRTAWPPGQPIAASPSQHDPASSPGQTDPDADKEAGQ